MKMIDDIVDGAVDDKVSLATILRKCLVVADKLQNEKLRKWVLGELNGYPDKDALPDYRVMHVNAVGFFIGTFGRQISGQPLPAFAMKEEDRHWATTAYLMEPIASYEALKAKAESDSLVVPWPGDLVAIYQRTWFPGQSMTLNRAHQVIPTSGVVALIDTVRNKLLELALELKKEIGSSEPTPQNPSPAVVESRVTNIIYGGQINLHGSSIQGDVSQGVGNTVVKGDFASLGNVLTQLGIPEQLLSGLKQALDEDQNTGSTKGLGSKTDSWLKSTFKAMGKGAFKVSEAIAVKVASDAILGYLGQTGASIAI